MAQLRAIVKAGRADIGFALDADGERLGIVAETGEALSEEMTLALCADIKLSRTPGAVVTNISTTQTIERSPRATARTSSARRSAPPISRKRSWNTTP